LLAGGLHQILVSNPRFLVPVPRFSSSVPSVPTAASHRQQTGVEPVVDPRFLVGKCTFCLPDRLLRISRCEAASLLVKKLFKNSS